MSCIGYSKDYRVSGHVCPFSVLKHISSDSVEVEQDETYLEERFCEEHFNASRPFYHTYKNWTKAALGLYNALTDVSTIESVARSAGWLRKAIALRRSFAHDFIHPRHRDENHVKYERDLESLARECETWIHDLLRNKQPAMMPSTYVISNSEVVTENSELQASQASDQKLEEEEESVKMNDQSVQLIEEEEGVQVIQQQTLKCSKKIKRKKMNSRMNRKLNRILDQAQVEAEREFTSIATLLDEIEPCIESYSSGSRQQFWKHIHRKRILSIRMIINSLYRSVYKECGNLFCGVLPGFLFSNALCKMKLPNAASDKLNKVLAWLKQSYVSVNQLFSVYQAEQYAHLYPAVTSLLNNKQPPPLIEEKQSSLSEVSVSLLLNFHTMSLNSCLCSSVNLMHECSVTVLCNKFSRRASMMICA